MAIIWTNDKPEKAFQLQEGKYACAMHLVAKVAKGKTAVTKVKIALKEGKNDH